jgi:transposase
MRARLRQGWPITVYKYHAEIIDPPESGGYQSLWDTAKSMQALWNNLVKLHEDTRKKVAESLEGVVETEHGMIRRVIWQEFKKQAEILAKTSGLNWECWPEVLDRFETACRTAKDKPAKDGSPGWPRVHHRLERIAIPHRYTGGGVEIKSLFSDRAKRFSLRSNNRLARGHFGLDEGRINFNIVLHRPLPENAIIKKVVWLGKRDVFGWHWSVSITMELPPQSKRTNLGRVAALDVGWRKIGDYLRVGMLVDCDGNSFEFRLPLIASTSKTRRANEHIYNRYKSFDETIPESYYESLNLDERIGLMVEEVKEKLKTSLPDNLPDEIRASVAQLTKMRQGGLVRLLRALEAADLAYASQNQIREWLKENDKLRRRKTALDTRLLNRRRWIYGNIANWIANRYDVLIWEGGLNIKQMIESSDKAHALKLADRYHQWAATSELRLQIKNASAKSGMRIMDGVTAFSSSTCHVCGEQVEKADEMLLRCKNGHSFDRDVNGGRNLLAQVITDVEDGLEVVEIPNHLTRYVQQHEHRRVTAA